MSELSQSQIERWRATHRTRQIERRERLTARQHLARDVARQIAQRLRRDFEASRIVAIGSLYGDQFHERSDIDLVAWDIPSDRYYEAVAAANSVDSGFLVDLLRGEELAGSLQDVVSQGAEL